MGFAQIDAAGRFTLANNRFCSIVGRSAPERLQMRVQDLVDLDDLPEMTDSIRHAFDNEKSFVLDTRYVLPDASRRWIRSNVAAIADHAAAVRHLTLAGEDVTKPDRAHER